MVLIYSISHSFTLFERKFSCFDQDYPNQKYSLVFNSNLMSVSGTELLNPLEFIECRKNTHESKYELKSMGCKDFKEERLWSFNNITNILTTENKKSPGVRQQILICKKI